ncbi:MAG: hypothetical protein ACFCU4_05235 [Puniceicoccaceae bacterium]
MEVGEIVHADEFNGLSSPGVKCEGVDSNPALGEKAWMEIPPFKEEEFEPVVRLCQSWGASEGRARVLARQLLRRAGQIAEERDQNPYVALEGLLKAATLGQRGETLAEEETP